jgi:type II restriction enzyme
MNLSMTADLAAAYTSGSQRARVVTEFWAEQNLYCPNCSSGTLNRQTHNTRAFDFRCPVCRFDFQLKGQKTPFRSSITDGAYRAMMDAVQNDALPSFYFLHYDLATWSIRNLLLVPHFAFPPSAIIKRPPLSTTARRAGWIGCNFDLRRIPIDARIEIVRTCISTGSSETPAGFGVRQASGAFSLPTTHKAAEDCRTPRRYRADSYFKTIITPAQEVREKFRRVKPLSQLSVKTRGWTLDVLNAIHRLGKKEFTTADAYIFERELAALHPDNHHVTDKIRQQLQKLRDLGLLLHIDRNRWRVP